MEAIRHKRPLQQQFWLGVELGKAWPATFVAGDCSAIPSIKTEMGMGGCQFTHPWVPDDVNPWEYLDLEHAITYTKKKTKEAVEKLILFLVVGLLVVVIVSVVLKDYFAAETIPTHKNEKKTAAEKKKQ